MGESRIALVEGISGGLSYRGFAIEELVQHASYEAVVHLLLRGAPPSASELARLESELSGLRTLPDGARAVLAALPTDLPPLEALRTLISSLGDGRALRLPPDPRAGARAGRPGAAPPGGVRSENEGAGAVGPRRGARACGPVSVPPDGSPPDPGQVRALESVLHPPRRPRDERVDVRPAGRPQHPVRPDLRRHRGPRRPERPAAWRRPLEGQRHARPGRHRRERRAMDRRGPRAPRAPDGLRPPGLQDGGPPRAGPASASLGSARRRNGFGSPRPSRPPRSPRSNERSPGLRLFTNVEFYGAVVLEAAGLPRELFTPTFAVARTAGWAAHALEQADDNRLIRPEVGVHRGPARSTLAGRLRGPPPRTARSWCRRRRP